MSVLIAITMSIGAPAVVVTWLALGPLAAIPASVYGFASVAGLILLSGLSPVDAILPTMASLILGAAFGWAAEQVGGMLTKSSPVIAGPGVAPVR